MIRYNLPFVLQKAFNNSLEIEAKLVPSIEYYGAYSDSELIGYSKNMINEYSSIVFYETLNINPDYIKNYISYALLHRMNEIYLNDRSYHYVCDGSRNLLHETGIQDFLIRKFKFRKAYCDLNIRYSRKVAAVLFLVWPFRRLIMKSNMPSFKKIQSLIFQHNIFLNQIDD